MGINLPKPNSGVIRSQALLQQLVARTDFARDGFDHAIEWVSPVEPDYAEYYDEDFLEQLQLSDLKVPIKKFWPRSGPRWDGLGIAKDPDQTRILVEAKAYIEEADTNPTGAGEKSKGQIKESLKETREHMKATGGHADWSRSFYQTANRLAHLYFLQHLNNIPTELWFVCFCDLPEEPKIATSIDEWKGALRLLDSHLGLRSHNPLRNRIHHVFVDAESLKVHPSTGS